MKEGKLKLMLADLFKATYRSSGYDMDIISSDYRTIIESIIRNHLIETKENDFIELNSKIGSLEAKVFMYEQIISKSNFAPMITEKIPEEKTEDPVD